MTKTLYPTILTLADNTLYYGWSLHNSTISLGEIVFNTGMTGYQEIITDPSYYGQIITFTYPEIGNTGINKEDNESNNIYIKGIVTKNICFKTSNWRSKISFMEYIIQNKIPHIFGIDTRSLTKHIRQYGSMNACISSANLDIKHIQKLINKTLKMEGTNLAIKVTTKKQYMLSALNSSFNYYKYSNYHIFKQKPYKQSLDIIVLDLGVKHNIINRLLYYGCQVNVLSANSTYNDIIDNYNVDGIVISNGPGDPAAMINIIQNITELIKKSKIPILGICMGHQILSLALGGQTYKLPFGHRGINHPTETNNQNRIEITSQNHGFAVKIKSLKNIIHITHFNLNDDTVAGIIHKNKPIFSVQYHPEASPGPHDSDYLFDHFIYLVELTKTKQLV